MGAVKKGKFHLFEQEKKKKHFERLIFDRFFFTLD